jgi:hypothetical protein
VSEAPLAPYPNDSGCTLTIRLHFPGETAMMRTTALCFVALVLVACAPKRSFAQTAKEIIQKAIDAHGGLDNLKKYPGAKATEKGKMTIMNLEATIESEETYLLPDQFKSVMKIEVLGQKQAVTQIFSAGKMKTTANGVSLPLSDAMKDEMKNSMNVHVATELYPLLEDKKFEISAIANPEKVGGKDVVGVLVKMKGQKDCKLFFDAKTFVMVKIERKGLDFTEKEVDQQMLLLDNKKFDGILRPVKYDLLFDGKKVATVEVVSFKHLAKVDKKEFDIAD